MREDEAFFRQGPAPQKGISSSSNSPRGRSPESASPSSPDSARAIISSCHASSRASYDVATRLGEGLGAHLNAGETLPDQTLLLDLAGRRVRDALARLIEADEVHGRAVMKHVHAQRARRRWAKQELYPRVRDARREIDAIFGYEKGREVHGLEGRTRRKIDPLRFQARTLIKKLESQGDEAPFTRTGGEAVDPRGWLRDVRPAYGRLKELAVQLGLQVGEGLGWHVEVREQQASAAKEAKDDLLEAFDDAYGKALRYARAAYDMAGLGPQALRRLRSFEQRRRLERWAGFRRENRAAKKKGATEKKVTRGKVASLADWLRRRWAAGR